MISRIVERKNVPGPAPLDLLETLATTRREVALLHAADGSGPSILAIDPLHTLEWRPGIVDTRSAPGLVPCKAPDLAGEFPLETLEYMMRQQAVTAAQHVATDDPTPGFPGWIGFLSYDVGREIESIPAHAHDDTHLPRARFSLYDCTFFFDPRTNAWTLCTLETSEPRAESAEARLDRMQHLLSVSPVPSRIPSPATLIESLPRETYLRHVRRILAYISAGDIYQANYAQRWAARTPDAPAAVFRRLCATSPAAYAAYLQFDNRAILSASPELFFHRDRERILTEPIKGTRPRDPRNAARDASLRDELLASAKDHAELVMITDLLRNDLGRFCDYGSVKVQDPRKLTAHPTVWHTSSLITGRVKPGSRWRDVLTAMCPGGSITGAPKIRAMQIIEELEPFRRGVYCGNIGCIDPAGTGTFNIAIRTIQMIGQIAHVWAGGGIVADSDPSTEYDETLHKAAAMFRALNLEVPYE